MKLINYDEYRLILNDDIVINKKNINKINNIDSFFENENDETND